MPARIQRLLPLQLGYTDASEIIGGELCVGSTVCSTPHASPVTYAEINSENDFYRLHPSYPSKRSIFAVPHRDLLTETA